MDTQTFKVGDEVTLLGGVDQQVKLVIVSIDSGRHYVRDEDGLVWHFPYEGYKLQPYVGSDLWWHREGRALYADAQAKLAAVEAAKAAIRQEIALYDADLGSRNRMGPNVDWVSGVRDGLQRALDLLEGK